MNTIVLLIGGAMVFWLASTLGYKQCQRRYRRELDRIHENTLTMANSIEQNKSEAPYAHGYINGRRIVTRLLNKIEFYE